MSRRTRNKLSEEEVKALEAVAAEAETEEFPDEDEVLSEKDGFKITIEDLELPSGDVGPEEGKITDEVLLSEPSVTSTESIGEAKEEREKVFVGFHPTTLEKVYL